MFLPGADPVVRHVRRGRYPRQDRLSFFHLLTWMDSYTQVPFVTPAHTHAGGPTCPHSSTPPGQTCQAKLRARVCAAAQAANDPHSWVAKLVQAQDPMRIGGWWAMPRKCMTALLIGSPGRRGAPGVPEQGQDPLSCDVQAFGVLERTNASAIEVGRYALARTHALPVTLPLVYCPYATHPSKLVQSPADQLRCAPCVSCPCTSSYVL